MMQCVFRTNHHSRCSIIIMIIFLMHCQSSCSHSVSYHSSLAKKLNESCQIEPVIIVGAGIAGAKIALELSKQNIPFIIIEATDRVGGRMRSVTVPSASCSECSALRTGFQYELGANWMQGYRKGVPFFDFVDKYVKLKGTATDFDDTYFVQNGSYVSNAVANPVWERFEDAMSKVYESTRTMKKSSSSEQYLNLASALLYVAGYEALHPIEHAAMRSIIDFEYAVPANDVSAQHLSPIYDPKAPESVDFFVSDPRGFKVVVDVTLTMAGVQSTNSSKSKLLLNSPVRNIVYGKKRALVITRAGEKIYGSAVVSTLPLGVLQASLFSNPIYPNAVRFTPHLSNERKLAISKHIMADYLKILVQFRWPLFSAKDPLFLIPVNCSEGGFVSLQNLNKKNYFPGSNAIIITSTDAYSRDLVCMNRQKVLVDVLEYVSMALGRVVHKDDVIFLEIPHFLRDQYFRGSYGGISPSVSIRDREEFNKPSQSLFFAGEAHNNNGLNGYVHGAWDSGMSTANAVLEFVKCE